MFKVTKVDGNRLDIELDGKIDSAEMRAGLDALEELSENMEDGLMLYDIVEFHLPSLEAIVIEISRLPSLFGLIKKFNKIAVLSDKNWIKKASELEGLLIPGITIKAFDRDQQSDAESWLYQTEPAR